MAEISGQLFGVVLVVAGAIGYLGLVLRRSWAGRGGCSSCHVTKSSADMAEPAAAPPSQKPGGQTAFFPLENLADIARLRREQQDKQPGT